MSSESEGGKTHIVDLNILNSHNDEGCAACKQKFSLGETVVVACGPWENGCAKLIHESCAVYDERTRTWYERQFYRGLEGSKVG